MQTKHYKNDFKNDIHYFFADISFAFIYFETLARRYAILQDIYYEKFHKNVAQQRSRQQVTASKNKSPKACQEGKKMDINGHFSRKPCLRTYQKITCEPNISWLEACRSKRPLNSYRPEQSLRRLSSNHFTFAQIFKYCKQYYQCDYFFANLA